MERMSIGDFARASGLTAKALRLYDEMGLLRPAQIDQSNGYRYYCVNQLEHARLIARLRLVGMPLDRIRTAVSLSAGARVAELMSFWRQVEADNTSRRTAVALLVNEARTKETGMNIDDTPRPEVAARTGIGSRDSQLDAHQLGTRLYAVADGFGDSTGVAASALNALGALEETTGVIDPVRLIDEAITRAADAVAKHPGSGSTLTAVMFGHTQAAVAHIGDSRAYLVRGGRLERLTRDHTFVQSLVDEGKLTSEEAGAHRRRADLNRALASDVSLDPDISVHSTRSGDRFVLTTDGVHAVVPSNELSTILIEGGSPEEAVERVEVAVLKAGAPDNYAVVVIDLPTAIPNRNPYLQRVMVDYHV